MKNRVQTQKVLPQKCVRGVCRLTLFAVANAEGGVRCE